MPITVAAINIYPVKSLAGISLDFSTCTSRGLQYDRRFMLVDANDEFITQREQPLMATIRMAINDATLLFTSPFGDTVSVPLAPPVKSTRAVTVWSSVVQAHTVSEEANGWLTEYLGMDVRLVYMPDSAERRVSPDYARSGEIVSFADGYPLLIASEESLADLNARMVATGGDAVPMNRFRPNMVVRGGEAFAEDTWGEFQIGDAIFRCVKPCTRCAITTIDQATGEVRGPEPLRTLANYRDSSNGVKFGMNLLPVTLGLVRVGDALTLL